MDNNSETLIEIEGLYQIFGSNPNDVLPKVKAGASKDEILAETGHTIGLQDINLKVKRGEIFVIMGLSGSGKSTLIRHFNRLIDPTAGKIKVDGENIMELSPKDLITFRRHKMAMVFQHFGLMPHRCVLDNVGYGLLIKGEKRAEWKPKATEWLETVGLTGYEDQYPSQLSGGQQQRVGLARALCTNAEILLMDEAFSALDPLIRSEMQEQLMELQENLQKTIIFITHDLDEALRLGDRIAVLKDGKLVQVGTPVDIVLKPADDYVRAFAKDVNRARALTVQTIMTADTAKVEGNTAKEVRDNFPQDKEYTFVFNSEGYQGVLTKQSLDQLQDDDLLNDVLIHVEPVRQTNLLQKVIPLSLNTRFDLPVINKKGELKGRLESSKLADVLSP
ncbi:quaternary amine ABC transporter ATP-binding protein [Marinomonas primoryensis]|jgi:glycine betaine/proline transport system ATP-binding protein|uniref:Quaternary amine transport ATP-binding protein n=1 Tax=Marinomonas primoryensis TaxID=178399 RepID=A0A859CZG4_9GAMM|nr:glycine betaine/L-proline ABC transporter ATP-binding protein [Marinomonas primoryensis]QKK81582.1 Glycine betaine/L-proline transport ATP-binding protein ProV [Marinomonas primoryensis]|tara:strand:- start:2538 stop:3710 length:1173 start_codon:yes stop_codon:yes gene_type:complete